MRDTCVLVFHFTSVLLLISGKMCAKLIDTFPAYFQSCNIKGILSSQRQPYPLKTLMLYLLQLFASASTSSWSPLFVHILGPTSFCPPLLHFLLDWKPANTRLIGWFKCQPFSFAAVSLFSKYLNISVQVMHLDVFPCHNFKKKKKKSKQDSAVSVPRCEQHI